jgi:hypothetical protein
VTGVVGQGEGFPRNRLPGVRVMAPPYPTVLTRERTPDGEVIVDAGRGLPRGEEFTVTDLSQGRPVEMVMRTTSTPFALQVHADGKDVGVWSFQPSGGGWQDATFTIPAGFVCSRTVRVRLSPPPDAPLGTHTAYHYWFVQGE